MHCYEEKHQLLYTHIVVRCKISSTAGIRGSPALDVYSGEHACARRLAAVTVSSPMCSHLILSEIGSKFALEGIMDSLRYTVSRYNIHITNINPGPVKTSFGGKLSDARGSRQVFIHSLNLSKPLLAFNRCRIISI